MELVSQCEKCVYNSLDGTCPAFPEGIPEKIILNEFDHSKEFPGDNGIRFKGFSGESYTFQYYGDVDIKKAAAE